MNSTLQKRGFVVGLFIVTLFIISQTAFAYPITGNVVKTEKTKIGAGITPDSFLYFLDVALDNINLALTFDSGEKARKGLEIARERLLEVREMIEENKLEAAEQAKEEHGNLLNKVKESVQELEKDNSTEEIEEELEIEKELKEHEDDVEEVNTELKIKIKIEGALTEEQKALINSLLDSLKGQTGEVKIEIKNKKDKTKIKIKQETGKSDEEIEDEIEDLEEEIGLEEVEIKAEITGNKTQIKIENEFSTDAVDKNAIIDEIIRRFTLDKETVNKILKIETEDEEELEKDRLKVEAKTEEGITEIEVKLRFTLTTADKEAIVNKVVARSQLSKEDIEKVLELKTEEEEKEKEELEIEVEIEDETADVKIEIGDNEQEFTLETTDKEAILSEIATRLGVTVEQIRDIVEFELKEKGLIVGPPVSPGVSNVSARDLPRVESFRVEATILDIYTINEDGPKEMGKVRINKILEPCGSGVWKCKSEISEGDMVDVFFPGGTTVEPWCPSEGLKAPCIVGYSVEKDDKIEAFIHINTEDSSYRRNTIYGIYEIK